MSPKHGGDRKRIDLSDTLTATLSPEYLLELDEALKILEEEDQAIAAIVKLRFFVGLTIDESAQLLDISERTAYRYWAYARARLHQELGREE